MISIESALIAHLSTAIKTQYSNAFVSGEYVSQPAKFPAVFIEETDNTSDRRTMDSSNTEKYANCTCTVDIFSNKNIGKKAECRAIANLVDNYLTARGFERTSLIPVPNLNDPNIYRMRGVYAYKVSANKTIYRRG